VTLAPASCCCDQEPVGPCAPLETYGPLTICLKNNAGTEWKYKLEWTGACDCAVDNINDCPIPTASAPTYGGGCSIVQGYYACDCPFSGLTCTEQSITAQRQMQGCYALPFTTKGQYSSAGYYITPEGNPTTLIAPTAGITVQWAVPIEERFSFDKQTYGTCEQCETWTLIQDTTGLQMPYRARFSGPPYITNGPPVWTIRKQTTGSVASRWEITSTAFNIRNSSGVIVYTIALAGQTLGSLFTAIDTQTAAPVVLVKQYTPIGVYNADLMPATSLEPRAQSPVFSGLTTQTVRLFDLASGEQRRMALPTVTPVPDPIPGAAGAVNPWGSFQWQFDHAFGQTTAPYTNAAYSVFAADVGYSEATVAAFCGGFAHSWDWDWIQNFYDVQCANWTPGENPPGSPQIGSFTRTTDPTSCNGCPFGVESIPCSSYGGYTFEDLLPLKAFYVLGTEGTGKVTSADMCLQQYGGVRDYWVCDPFESEADCCCPEVNGDNCSSAFRLFSGCAAVTSSFGQFAEYVFSVSR
jgi:hypothetical protein